jgi:hypothetical protein
MLLEEAEKLYNKLAKELGDEIIGDCLFNTPSSLLPLSPPTEERQTHPATTADDQTHMHAEEHRLFTQSEMDDDH